ncbi:MAG: histidine kinase [Bacteroidetes bacterium]|nr:histidine kinase [Bacteroidota bacterium]
MQKLAAYLLASFLAASTAEAQPFNFVRYTVDDGLPSNTVYSLVQDNLGYLWMGTADGLCRFDGTSFTYFREMPGEVNTVKGEKFLTLRKDRSGNIWAGTENSGLNFISSKTGEITNYQYAPGDTASLNSNQVTCIFEDHRGRLWAGAQGLNLLDRQSGRFRRVLLFKDEAALKKYNGWQLEFLDWAQDPADSAVVWLTAAYGICRFNVETFEARYFFPSDKPIAFRASFLDDDGFLWLTDWGTGLHRFDLSEGTFELFKCGAGGSDVYGCQNAAGIMPFDKNRLLVASENAGLMFFEKKSGQFTHLSGLPLQNELPTAPRQFFKDRDGNLWITTIDNGLYCLQPQRQVFKKTPLEGNILQAIRHPLEDRVYACSEEGVLYVLDEKKLRVEAFSDPAPSVPNTPGLADLAVGKDGQLWILGYHDLYNWQKGDLSLKPLAWQSWKKALGAYGYFWDFAFDRQNHLWMSTQSGGLGRLGPERQTVQIYRFEKDNPHSLAHDYSISRIFVDNKDNVWGATANAFFYYDKKNGLFFNSPEPPAVSGGGRVFTGSRGFAQDKAGNIWMTAGLNRIGFVRPGDPVDAPVHIVKTSVPLPSARVWGMLAGPDGNIWIGSDAGLTRINPKTYAAEHYGEAYGLSAVNNLSLAANGEIFAAVSGGFFRFHPDSVALPAKAPVPVLTGFKVFDKPYGDGIAPSFLENVRLSYRQNFFSFEFSALDFTSKGRKEFSYKLEGLEKDWVMAGERRYVAYANLRGGDYAFKVKVRNEAGHWSEPLSLPIRIIPPVWERWWFWALVLLSLASAVYGIYRYRVSQIRREEAMKTVFHKQLAEMEMKALRAQMNPHFLFNSLNAIKFYVLKRSKEKAADYLTDFARLIRLVLHNSSQQLITLEQELEALELYIRIERLRFDEQFDFEIKTEPEVDAENFLIPPLLLQPYVENAIWHGLMHKKDGKGRLLVGIEQENGALRCVIEDNGIGREKAREVKSKSAQRSKSMGMSITRNRMNISQLLTNMHFDVQIEDLVDPQGNAAGTKVVISIRSNV